MKVLTFLFVCMFVLSTMCVTVAEQVEEADSPILGGFIQMRLQEAEKIEEYLKGRMPQLKNQKLIKYDQQVVNGFNHRLIYLGDKGQTELFVYENIDGVFSPPITNELLPTDDL